MCLHNLETDIKLRLHNYKNKKLGLYDVMNIFKDIERRFKHQNFKFYKSPSLSFGENKAIIHFAIIIEERYIYDNNYNDMSIMNFSIDFYNYLYIANSYEVFKIKDFYVNVNNIKNKIN